MIHILTKEQHLGFVRYQSLFNKVLRWAVFIFRIRDFGLVGGGWGKDDVVDTPFVLI